MDRREDPEVSLREGGEFPPSGSMKDTSDRSAHLILVSYAHLIGHVAAG